LAAVGHPNLKPFLQVGTSEESCLSPFVTIAFVDGLEGGFSRNALMRLSPVVTIAHNHPATHDATRSRIYA